MRYKRTLNLIKRGKVWHLEKQVPRNHFQKSTRAELFSKAEEFLAEQIEATRKLAVNTNIPVPNLLQTKRALKDKEASAYIGMSQSWLRHGRVEGTRFDRIPRPPFIKIGRSVRYLIEDLDIWLEKFQKLEHLAQLTCEEILQKNHKLQDE